MPEATLLEDVGRMIEFRKYLNKLIIIDFEIEKLEFEIFGRKLKFDKWLDFKDWIFVYEKVLTLLENTKTSIQYFKNSFKTETFKIHNNTVEVKITKENFKEKEYQHLFDLDDLHNFHVFVVKIKIKLVVAVDNKINNETESSADKTNLKSHNLRSIHSNNPDVKEYYPAFNEITDADKIPSYKPSKVAFKNELEQYSPQPVENAKIKITEKAISPKCNPSKDNKNQIPRYKASPILPSSGKTISSESDSSAEKKVVDKNEHKIRELRSLRSAKCDISVKYKKYKNDDSEENNKIEPNKHKKGKFEENSESKTQSEDDYSRKKVNKEKKVSAENENGITTKNWLHKSIIKHRTTPKVSNKSKISSSKSSSAGLALYFSKPTKELKLTDEERKIVRKNDEKDIKKMLEVTEQLKDIIKPSTVVEFRSLHHLAIDTIKNTYENNKDFFEKQFSQNINRFKGRRRKFDADGLDHMFVHSILHEEELMEMSKFLQNIFEPDSSVPEFTDIFFNLMVPEWVLLLYMDEYKLTRSEAINYLKDQEESLICTQMESSGIQVSS